jgi:beta-galactosidase/beta-glucuronidase
MRFRVTLAALLLSVGVVAQDIPRSEYPEPQFQREQWQTLNGRWEFEFDDQNKGLAEDWPASAKKFTKSILVPYCFESTKSGIGDTSFHPWVWYRRTFSVPDAWKGRRVQLKFGAVDYRAKVWVNGRITGEHEGGNVPFRFDITPYLHAGSNVIMVRAEDPPTDRFIPRGKQFWEPKSRSIFYTRTTGIWQPVWIEATGDSYLDRVRITPSNDGTVKFEAAILRPDKELEFTAAVRQGDKTLARGMTGTDAEHAVISASIASPRLWSVGSPNLYEVTFELRRGDTVVDKVNSYFGFRTVAVENSRVTLNGRPIYVKMALDQGYWPESTLTPPSDDAIQYDIKMTKDMGFNGVRKHQKLEDPRYLYWADRMGLLVSSEMANAQGFDDAYVRRFTREWTEAVERDYNHPSIIMWVPINESWGTPNLNDKRQQDHLKAMYMLTHSLDSTRLVIDNDGWEHTDMTDLFAIHDYTPRGDVLEKKYRDAGKTGTRFPDNGKRVLIPGYQYNGTPILLSEFGGISYIMPGQKAPPEAWGYSGLEPNGDAALARLRSLYEGIANIPAFAGICYTQLTDVEQEINGLMTFDRKPKFPVAEVKKLNDLLK